MADRLRIAQVAPVAAPVSIDTGQSIEQHLYLLTEELVRRGHEVTLFATADSTTSAALHSVYSRGYHDDPDLWDWQLHETMNAAAAFERADEFDLIHCHCYQFALPFTRLVGATVLHSDHVPGGPDVAAAYRRYPEVHLVAPSLSHSRQMTGLAPAVIHHGIDVDAFPFSASAGDYLLFLGRMEWDKGPVAAIKAARAVGLPLVLAGPPSDYFTREVAPLVDGVSVRFVGAVNRERRNELLAGAAALLFPIQWPEPFGLVMVESMACGTPVAATSEGAVPEVIDPGVTGSLAVDTKSLPAAIRSCLTLDRRHIREVAERRFHYCRMVDDYEALYARILAGATAGVA
ncbi:MAG: glycosyltransferase family 4 protein [Solirubrobacteraceae bacterium]